jgi:hypothetical protein
VYPQRIAVARAAERENGKESGYESHRWKGWHRHGAAATSSGAIP